MASICAVALFLLLFAENAFAEEWMLTISAYGQAAGEKPLQTQKYSIPNHKIHEFKLGEIPCEISPEKVVKITGRDLYGHVRGVSCFIGEHRVFSQAFWYSDGGSGTGQIDIDENEVKLHYKP